MSQDELQGFRWVGRLHHDDRESVREAWNMTGRAAGGRCLGKGSRDAPGAPAERRQVRAGAPATRGRRNAISVRDCGSGFEWRRFLDLDESRALHPNGRGIAIARHVAFRTLELVEPGNVVIVTLPSPR